MITIVGGDMRQTLVQREILPLTVFVHRHAPCKQNVLFTYYRLSYFGGFCDKPYFIPCLLASQISSLRSVDRSGEYCCQRFPSCTSSAGQQWCTDSRSHSGRHGGKSLL